MTPDRWLDVERLFHAASALPANERADFLAQTCAEDDALRREVESLLAHELSAESFLATPTVDALVEVMPQVLSTARSSARIEFFICSAAAAWGSCTQPRRSTAGVGSR